MVNATDEGRESEEDFDAFNEVVMAVDMKSRGEIGCAYYLAREETLYFMEEVKSGSVDIIDGRKLAAASIQSPLTGLSEDFCRAYYHSGPYKS